jgi:hypothetical protein
MTLDAEHKGGVLHASQTASDAQGGQQTTEGTWYEDGKEHPMEQFGPGKSITKWNGSTLVNDKRSNDGQYQEHITLTLSRDGKTATEKIHVKNPNGENDSTLIWERK